MNAQEYMNQIRRVDEIIKQKKEQICDLRFRATSTTASWGGERVQSSGRNDAHERLMIKIIDLERECEKKVEELIDIKREVMNTIDSLSNPLHIKLLYMRYVNLRSWNRIANEMYYSPRGIFKLHKAALKAVQVVLDAKN